MIDNRVEVISNYETEELQETLYSYSINDYKLVNTIMAKNRFGIEVMYLFFTKERQ